MSGWSVDADDLRDIATALRYEEDGVRLRRALAKELRDAVAPAVETAKSSILSMGDAGLPEEGEPLRAAIAAGVTAKTRLTSRAAGVRVAASRKGMPRDFVNAPKRTNRASGWRHPVPPPRLPKGAEGPRKAPQWVRQFGKPGWFDDPLQARAAEYRAAVERVIRDAAERIRRGAR